MLTSPRPSRLDRARGFQKFPQNIVSLRPRLRRSPAPPFAEPPVLLLPSIHPPSPSAAAAVDADAARRSDSEPGTGACGGRRPRSGRQGAADLHPGPSIRHLCYKTSPDSPLPAPPSPRGRRCAGPSPAPEASRIQRPPSPVPMEQLNAKLYDKYTALKKRKLLDEGLDQKRVADIKELQQAMKDWVAELQSENERLITKLTQKEQQLVEAQTLLLDETRKTKELNSEILKLQCLLAEKNDANHIATGSPDTTTEMILENQTPTPPAKKTPKSNSRERNMRSIEKAIVPRNGFHEEGRDLDSCRRHMGISGSATEESSSTCMFHMLVETIVGMTFSVKNKTEGFSLSVSHEASGYNFTLTWVDQPGGGEWSYQYSSLGTLDRIAKGWMKEDIKFSKAMCPVFFKQISCILRQG